jgi:predicted SnoaL-like aldol condensation-catalyzing enzyme
MANNFKFIVLLVLVGLLGTTVYAQRVPKTKKKISNKDMVLAALTAVFVNGDTLAVEKYWAKDYIQHNPMFPNGRDVLKEFAKNKKTSNFKFEPGLVIEQGEFVMLHSRYSGAGSKPMIVVDILRVKNGKIVEHWDIAQEEVSTEKTVSGNPMFPIK